INGPDCQIVNLGCGFDTLYWRLRHDHPDRKIFRKFVEIDFSSITAKKISQILKIGHEILRKTISQN
uniref:[phosphatase 2A protein]-leucine-carboxy methyltransferase n=1 Tax=Romanomermis culicivorax TaxID=13658 RepID=A0A915J4P7_ROMCU